jgi:deoxycytidylate deaminase
MTKVVFSNGYQTELKDEIAKSYEKKGRVKIVKKPGRKAKDSKESTEQPEADNA